MHFSRAINERDIKTVTLIESTLEDQRIFESGAEANDFEFIRFRLYTTCEPILLIE